MTKHLIVNADDFGYSHGVSLGIMEAHRQGIVTSTTTMVNIPYAADAIALALVDTPALGLGLHLNVTAGKPVLPPDAVPDLVGIDGEFLPREQALIGLQSINAAQLEAELRAQLNHFIQLAGRPPDHLDSHHHATYASATAVEIMIKLAHELGIGIRRPLPDMSLTAIAHAMGFPDPATQEIETLAHTLDKADVPMPDRFIMSFYKTTATLGDLLNILIGLPDGISEIMCHPAYVDDVLLAKSSYIKEREHELAALTHPSVREILESEDIQLITFSALVNR